MNKYLRTTATAHMYTFRCPRCAQTGFIWIKVGHNRTFNCPHACGQTFLQNDTPPKEPQLIALQEIKNKA